MAEGAMSTGTYFSGGPARHFTYALLPTLTLLFDMSESLDDAVNRSAAQRVARTYGGNKDGRHAGMEKIEEEAWAPYRREWTGNTN